MAARTFPRLRLDELANNWVSDRNTPFQIGLLAVFDRGPFGSPGRGPDTVAVADALTTRAAAVARLSHQVVWTRPGQGRPVWAVDPAFDPAGHIHRARLPVGTDLWNWAADESVRPLDRTRPLWRATVVDGLPDGRFAALIVLHHILADGLAAVGLAASLFDGQPDGRLAPSASAAPNGGQTDSAGLSAAGLPTAAKLVSQHLREVGASLVSAPRRWRGGAGRVRGSIRQMRAASQAFPTPVPETSLPRTVGPFRRMSVVRLPLDQMRDCGHTLGATVNDLLLTCVAGGLRTLLLARAERTDDLSLRATVPAATARTGQAVGMLVVDLPVGESDPLRALGLIHDQTLAGKLRLRSGEGDAADMLSLPAPLARPLVRMGRRFGSKRLNLSVTNVPGPQQPIWLAGARMVFAVPVAPLVPLVPLTVGAVSYDGVLTAAANADASIADLSTLTAGMAQTWQELRQRTSA